jgi:hypothetical protein
MAGNAGEKFPLIPVLSRLEWSMMGGRRPRFEYEGALVFSVPIAA